MGVKVYLAGPMTGYFDDNRPLFNREAERLRRLGHEVINPADLDRLHTEVVSYKGFLRRDLPYMLQCQSIFILPGWRRSTGATLETAVARVLEIPVMALPDLTPIRPEDLPEIRHPV